MPASRSLAPTLRHSTGALWRVVRPGLVAGTDDRKGARAARTVAVSRGNGDGFSSARLHNGSLYDFVGNGDRCHFVRVFCNKFYLEREWGVTCSKLSVLRRTTSLGKVRLRIRVEVICPVVGLWNDLKRPFVAPCWQRICRMLGFSRFTGLVYLKQVFELSKCFCYQIFAAIPEGT